MFSVIGIGTPSFWLAALLVLAFVQKLRSPARFARVQRVAQLVPADASPAIALRRFPSSVE